MKKDFPIDSSTPPGPVGNTLMVTKELNRVVLDWSDATEAFFYNVKRCDATAGSCAPQQYATATSSTYNDDNATPMILWYFTEAVNPCGITGLN